MRNEVEVGSGEVRSILSDFRTPIPGNRSNAIEKMAYDAPILRGNPDEPSLVTMEEYNHHYGDKKAKKGKLPIACLLVFQPGHVRLLGKERKLEKIGRMHEDIYRFKQGGASLAVTWAGLGAPAAVLALEFLVGTGIKHFIAVGCAGAIQRKMKTGEAVVCTHAVREEGTSYHYAAPTTYSYADAALTNELGEALTKRKIAFRRGSSWTTDAPYRETKSKVRHYRREGVLSVEMEAAALFTVAEARKVKMASCFAISDSLAELKWEPAFGSKELKAAWLPLLLAAADALAGAVKSKG